MVLVMDYYNGTEGVPSSDYIFLVEFGLFDMREIIKVSYIYTYMIIICYYEYMKGSL